MAIMTAISSSRKLLAFIEKKNFLILTLISILLSFFQADPVTAQRSKTCPTFDCSSPGSTYKLGFFCSAKLGDLGPNLDASVLSQTDMGQISGLPLTADASKLVASLQATAQTGLCYKNCQDYNKMAASGGGSLAAYWSLSLYNNYVSLGLSSFKGKCFCYAASACATVDGRDLFDGSGSPYIVSLTWNLFLSGSLCVTGWKGDPHFVGADNSHFDFSGIPGRHFSLVSDTNVQVNALFDGRYGPWAGNPHKALTWIRQVAFLWGPHSLLLEARSGADASYGAGYLQRILADGEELQLRQAGDSMDVFGNGQVEVTWLVAGEPEADDVVDKYEVRLGRILTVVLTLRPEVEVLRREEDGTVHFGVSILEANLSPSVHGVLGQTYRPDFRGRLERQKLHFDDVLKLLMVPGENAEGFIDGSVEDYMTSDLLSTDCKFCNFAPPSFARKLKL